MTHTSGLSLAITAALFVCASAHAEKAVFKCVGPNGSTVFSPTPCGKDAKEVDTSAALKTGTSPNLQGVSDRAALAAIDSDCAIRDQNIRDASEHDLRFLRADMRRSANNLAGATRDSGIRGQIDGVISRRDGDLAKLDEECRARRSDESRRQADRDAQKTASAQQ